MKEFKGTEYPWVVVTGKSAGFQVVSESAPKTRRVVASCGGVRRELNGNLIASAPEILEVLQKISHEVGFFLMHQNPELMSEIDLAINKSLGVE
ncbi:MAG: hypothetical protein [Caudoviricetes sp.]|nr:MAG: hypothetical protein [Caudoviricetes sp.]